jgi:hypothetical protein
MTHSSPAIITVASLSSALSACPPPFASPAIVDYPRVLAIIAKEPTVAPGSLVSLAPIVGGNATEGTYRWRICVRPEVASTGLPLSSFGAFEPERGCDTDGALELTAAQTGRVVQFAIPSDLFSNEQVLRTAFGGGLRLESARSLAQRAGISVVASVEWTVDGTVATAFKRVLVRDGEINRNPPPPVIRVKNRELRAGPLRTNEACEFTDTSGPLRVTQGERVLFQPDTDVSWLEEFTFVDASDNLVTVSEGAFRNWFSTAGSWDFGRARAPDTNPTWIAPKRAGDVTMWMVLRDGHGGASVCRWSARVE